MLDLLTFWDNLFFNKINYPNLGFFRILIGIICFCKILLLFTNRYEYFGPKGFYPINVWKNHWEKNISIFLLNPSNFNVDIILFFSVISSLLLTVGFCTEFVCFICYFLFINLTNRMPYIFNAGDSLLRIILLLLVFSNCGHYISVDNIIYNRAQLDAFTNPLAIRLIQIVTIKVYIDAFYSKLLNNFWLKGTGLYYCLNNFWVNRYNINPYLNKYGFIFLNYSTLIAESVVVLGLIFKETSTVCAFFLMFVHLLFEILLRINLFGIIMIACLLLFL